MLILVSGPNDSGKSSFAEALAARTRGRRVYLATMIPQTQDNRRRVEKHRRQRAGLGFVTVEEPFRVGALDLTGEEVVLLEDLSNLLANVIFEKKGEAQAVLKDVLTLASRCRHLILVTISGLSQEGYTGETAAYIHSLNTLNDALAREAQVVVELEEGQPRTRKGDWHGIS